MKRFGERVLTCYYPYYYPYSRVTTLTPQITPSRCRTLALAGRVSRLLTLLALYQHGYEVGRYISLERLIEEAKDDYYHVLQESSQRWHEGKHDLLPWLNHFLSIARRAYGEFERRAGQVKAPRGAKAGLVLAAIREQSGEFRLADIEQACPGVGREWIRSLLTDLKAAGEATCQGKGPAARWRYLRSKGSNS